MSVGVLNLAALTIREEWGPARGSAWSSVQNFHLAVADWLSETALIAIEGGSGFVPGEALNVARAYLGDLT